MHQFSNDDLLEELKKRFATEKHFLQQQKDLMEQLHQMSEKLSESEALKCHFLSNIRNEIIDPFTSILGLSKSISLMKEGGIAKIQHMASLIYEQAFALDFQLKNIFAAAAIETGSYVPETYAVDLRTLRQEIVDYFRHQYEQKEIHVEWKINGEIGNSTPAPFNTDAEKLYLIMANLFSNAIKFSPFGKKISIDIHLSERQFYFSIQDQGPGIQKMEKEQVFNRFNNLKVRETNRHSGNGLGMSIVKSLVELMGGTIQLTSKRNQGAMFTVLLPESALSVNDMADHELVLFNTTLKF